MTALNKYLLALSLSAILSLSARSQTSNDCPPPDALRRVYAAALQSKVKDTLIMQLNDRLQGLQFVIREYQIKDSICREARAAEIAIKDQQNKAALDNIATLNRDLRRARLAGQVFRGTTIAAIVFMAVKFLK